MGPPPYMRSVVDRNVVMLRIPVTIQYNTIQYNTIKYNTINTIQHNTIYNII